MSLVLTDLVPADPAQPEGPAYAVLTLNNPGERNTLTAPLVAEIVAAMDALEADPRVGAVVVTGAAPAFCAGANLGNLAEATEESLGAIYEASCASPAARCPPSPRSTAPRSVPA